MKMPRIGKFRRLVTWVWCLSLLPVFPIIGQDLTDERFVFSIFDLFFRTLHQSQQATPDRPLAASQARERFQSLLELDDQNMEEVLKAAQAYVREVAPIDAEAEGIIRSAKARYRLSPGATGSSVPPPPPELAELQQRKDQLMRQTLAGLEERIGPSQLLYLAYQIKFQVVKKGTVSLKNRR